MRAYFVEEGILLTEENEEFEAYSSVYDKKYGYYDEDQFYVAEEKVAIAAAKSYVENGVDRTYAVVSNLILPDDFDFDDQCLGGENYQIEDIIYSVVKMNGEIVEGFVDTETI